MVVSGYGTQVQHHGYTSTTSVYWKHEWRLPCDFITETLRKFADGLVRRDVWLTSILRNNASVQRDIFPESDLVQVKTIEQR